MAAALTPRGKALRRLSTHRGIVEEPWGSNTDRRPHASDARWGIRKAQQALGAWLIGLPWCGVWAAFALRGAGVKGVTYRLASVAFIEDDARARKAPFWDWVDRSEYRKVLRGDLVVLFGRGVHVGVVRGFKTINGRVYAICDEGNTSPGTGGSQSNGGGSYRRVRPLTDVHGFARVDYPGGAVKRAVDRALMRAEAARARTVEEPDGTTVAPSSDAALLRSLEEAEHSQAIAFREQLRRSSP